MDIHLLKLRSILHGLTIYLEIGSHYVAFSCLGTCFVDPGGFKITKHPPAFTAWAVGLKVGTTTFNAVFERHEMLHRDI